MFDIHVGEGGRVRLSGRLDAAEADDLSVVNGARVSFGTRRTRMEERDEGLIRFLMRDRHGSPFEHNFFRFHVKCPIFVTREWQRHRIGSFNERSARYSEMPEEFYVPAAGDVRSQVGKPGAYRFEPVADELLRIDEQMSLITYEIGAGLFKSGGDTAGGGTSNTIRPEDIPHGSPDVYFKFDGEYWSDEVGDYTVFSQDRCVR
jgi:hypothetical protein